jgi:uncharacterized repeat protein (TIGR01451 family)
LGASGGPFTLSGTVGQPDAGPAQAGGSYVLAGGFWAVAVPAGGPLADLSIVKSDSPDPVVGLQPLTYTLAVTNSGPGAASALVVTDTLPAGVIFQSAGGPGWSCGEASGVVTCTRPALAAGAGASITLTVTAPPQAASLSNTASVSAAEDDPAPPDNTDLEPTTVTAAPAADLAVAKSDGGVEARWGQPFVYTVSVSNAGPQPVAGAVMTDALPPGFAGASYTCSASAGSSCPAGGSGDIAAPVSLLAGGTATFTVTGTVTPGTATLVNRASIALPAGHFDPTPANNTDTVASNARPILYYAITPCRLADTRSTDPPALAAGARRSFGVGGHCGIPVDARAAFVVLTTVQQTGPGNLRLYPAGGEAPLASTINFVANHVRANNAIVPLGEAGRVDVQCDMPTTPGGQTHFVLDAYGYFR